ncbi:MAG: response regulator [Desulfobacterales bacterium]|nr:response regulator [Desulfobacterales bacterium]
MVKLLLATPDRKSLSELASALEEHYDVDLTWAESGANALDIISHTAVDLVIADEKLGDMTGLEFAERLVLVNPMVNCALVSPLSAKDFHDASEGLGLMAQLPIRPGEKQAEDMLQRLKKLKGLTAGANIGSA